MGSYATQFSFITTEIKDDWAALDADVVIIPVVETGKTFTLNAPLKKLDQNLQGVMDATVKDEAFTAKKGSVLIFRKTPADKVTARRIILLGLGKGDKIQREGLDDTFSKAFAGIIKLQKLDTVAVILPKLPQLEPESIVGAVVDAATMATYVSEESTKPSPKLPAVQLVLETTANKSQKDNLKMAEVFAKAASFTRDLVNKPANIKSTTTLVNAANQVGKAKTVTVKVQSSASWIEKNMPCFFEVAKGSLATDPPKFIHLHYQPETTGKTSKKKTKTLALVGKSVIFDTGGYQVKPGDYMNTMKGDMTGGACVLATMQALSVLKPDIEVHGFLAATPNKIDSDAMIPDSIVNTTCGKKVEIRHTDAEGRLTLIDAVTKAAAVKPDAMVTIATLTGAASVAVGKRMALMGNHTDFRNKVEAAARLVGDPVQPLDVLDEDYEAIESKLDGADIRNTQKGKGRGAQTAAAFVMTGAPEGLPMAHLDIAGADMTDDEKATGIGAKTLIQLVLDF